MRYRGRDYDGTGITVAVIDSGINTSDARLQGADIEGWSIRLSATGHAELGANYSDENGHGTEIAAAIRRTAPGARLIGIRIMDARLRTSADLMAAGIETAFRSGANVVNLSLGTPNMGKALLLRDCCALAVEAGSVVLAAAHPKGDRAYPADLPETVGVATNPDCPLDRVFHFSEEFFPRSEWGNLSGKFLTHGFERNGEERGDFKGSGLATAYLSGRFACLREALPEDDVPGLINAMVRQALIPAPELGYG
jgi:subtilisin family serine protease